MKKYLCFLLSTFIALSLLTGCQSEPENNNIPTEFPTVSATEEASIPTEPPATTEPETAPVTEPETVPFTELTEPETVPPTMPPATEAMEVMLPLPQEPTVFTFLSGAGGWGTVLTLHADGTFIGQYHDTEMGDRNDDYPNGTVYICSFSGRFENIAQLDAYSYRMTLSAVETEHPIGDEWIEEGVRYIASDPYGLEMGSEFIFYLPNTPIDMFSEEFLYWWPYRYEHRDNPKDTLSCYGILNVEPEYGFFYG